MRNIKVLLVVVIVLLLASVTYCIKLYYTSNNLKDAIVLPMQHNVRKLTVNSVRNMLVVLTKKEEKQS